MHTTNLKKVGESVMLPVPSAVLDELHLEEGSTVNISVEGDLFVVDPKVKPRYALDDLLAEWDKVKESLEDPLWIEMKPVGREL